MALQGSPRGYIGIEITNDAITLVELINRGPHISLATYAHTEYQASNAANTAELIKRMCEQAEVSSDSAIFSLPASELFSFTIKTPNIDGDELVPVINQKARAHVPVDLNQLELVITTPQQTKHHIIDTAPSIAKPQFAAVQPDTISVYVTAVPKELIDWYQQVTEAASLELVALEADIFPLLRISDPPQIPTIFGNLGSKEVSIYLVDDHGIQATQVLVEETSPVAIANALQEIHDLAPSKSQQAIIAGTQALDPTIANAFQHLVDGQVALAHPFQGLAVPQDIEVHIKDTGPPYAVAVGLARREI